MPLNEEKTEWQLVNFSGKYKFIKDDKIHIIYHDKPREEGFVRIIELSDGKLIVEMSAYKSMRRSNKYEYKKNKSYKQLSSNNAKQGSSSPEFL